METNVQFRPLGIPSCIKVSDPDFTEQIKYDPTVKNSLSDKKEWLSYVRKYMGSSVTASATSNGTDDDYTSDR